MDSLDVWAAITATSPAAAVGPRTEVPISATALVVGDHKLTLTSGRSNIWCPPDWPVGNSTPAPPCDTEAPCLFDLAADVRCPKVPAISHCCYTYFIFGPFIYGKTAPQASPACFVSLDFASLTYLVLNLPALRAR